jgi:hypothetical protein
VYRVNPADVPRISAAIPSWRAVGPDPWSVPGPEAEIAGRAPPALSGDTTGSARSGPADGEDSEDDEGAMGLVDDRKRARITQRSL